MAERLLVVGCGSVGKRHASNLHALGCSIAGVDPRADRRAEFEARVPGAVSFATLGQALGGERFTGAVIASPPSCHLADATSCLDAGLPLLLEKPVAPDLESARELATRAAQAGRSVLLGYSFRWWPPVERLKALVMEEAVGRVLRVEMHLAAHLADWHPWERYQDFFMASRALGGGALLDESHFLDLAVWMFGWPQDLFGVVEKVSGLDIDTDDNVEIVLSLPHGVRGVLHLDIFARPHQRQIRVYGEHGTIEWNNEENLVRTYRDDRGAWASEQFACERNEMFVREAREFLEVLAGRRAPSCTLDEGVGVLELVEAVRRSSQEGRRVPLGAVDRT